MNSYRGIKSFLIGIIFGSVLLSFQNCAEPVDLGNVGNGSGLGDSQNIDPNIPFIQYVTTDKAIIVGSPFQFTVAAEGPSLVYTWKKADVIVSNSNIFSRLAATSTDAGNYVLTVSNSYGSVSVSVTARLVSSITTPTPFIQSYLPNHTAYYGDGPPIFKPSAVTNPNTHFYIDNTSSDLVSFAVDILSTTGISFVWSKLDEYGNPVTLSAANSPNYSFNMTRYDQVGIYRVHISNVSGSAYLQSKLTLLEIN